MPTPAARRRNLISGLLFGLGVIAFLDDVALLPYGIGWNETAVPVMLAGAILLFRGRPTRDSLENDA